MNPAPGGSQPRLVIVGSTSPLGRDLGDVLEARGEWDLGLLETGQYESLLEEFGDRIGIVEALSSERLDGSDVAVLACASHIATEYLSGGLRLPALTIDTTGISESGSLFVSGISGPDGIAPPEVVRAPAAETIVLAYVLGRLASAAGLRSAEALVLEPASAEGADEVTRLETETAEVLNFQRSMPMDSRTRAFNVVGPDARSTRRARRVSRQASALGGPQCPGPFVQFVRVPVLHGMTLSLHVRTERELAEREVMGILTDNGRCPRVVTDRLTPAEVSGSGQIHVCHVEEGGDAGALGLWIVVDNLRLASANVLALLDGYVARLGQRP